MIDILIDFMFPIAVVSLIGSNLILVLMFVEYVQERKRNGK